MSTNQLVIELKENEQDTEFYPTTTEIISVLAKKLKTLHYNSLLDIGVGNGKVFKTLEHLGINEKWYAMEKSQILIELLPANVFIIGTDFSKQTLIDKKIDVIFSNPPYKEYRDWTVKIITEAYSSHIFLVLPERWSSEPLIEEALHKRSFEAEILGSFDFLNSEDRKARAKVNLIHIRNKRYNDTYYDRADDPFKPWFDENFNINIPKDQQSEYDLEREKKQKVEKEIVKGDLIPVLEKLYNKDMEELLQMFKSLETFDAQTLKELGVSKDGIREGLQLKIAGLKNIYWKELFDNLNKITDRLTSKSRKQMLESLTAQTAVDFSSDNAYAILIWTIKNANKYFETQLLALYKDFSKTENIKNYKSNSRIPVDNWRYLDEKHTHYKLDYRIVFQCYNNFMEKDSFSSYYYDENGFNKETKAKIDDICTVAENLGFRVSSKARDFEWSPGKEFTFYYFTDDIFMKIRAYKNGNIHIKFDQEFMKAFNVEAGRLNKWIKDKKEVMEELGLSEQDANIYFKGNIQFKPNDYKRLVSGDKNVINSMSE